MKLVANIKLLTDRNQFNALKQTLELANECCDWLSEKAWNNQKFRQFDLHKLSYKEARERFALSSQMVVRCIAKTADAYKLDTKVQRTFRKHAAQPYDDRIIRFADDIVSIWTVDGRLKIPFVMGEHQRKFFAHRKGEVDLMLVRGKFYLACVCDFDDPELIKNTDVLGVDLGVVNIAADSQGAIHSSAKLNDIRRSYLHRRKNLQRKQTRAAKRKLRSLKGKESRFAKHVNHELSKTIVTTAERSRSAIALEDLKGIRKRVKARKRQRGRLHSWGFRQLQTFIEYKARIAGIPVIFVDPRYTSQGCSQCGSIDKANRKTQDQFRCTTCDHAEHADINAARNIRARGMSNVSKVDNSG